MKLVSGDSLFSFPGNVTAERRKWQLNVTWGLISTGQCERFNGPSSSTWDLLWLRLSNSSETTKEEEEDDEGEGL